MAAPQVSGVAALMRRCGRPVGGRPARPADPERVTRVAAGQLRLPGCPRRRLRRLGRHAATTSGSARCCACCARPRAKRGAGQLLDPDRGDRRRRGRHALPLHGRRQAPGGRAQTRNAVHAARAGKGKPARRVTVIALNRRASGCATTSARIRAVAKGKRRVRGGNGLRTSAAPRRRRPRAAGSAGRAAAAASLSLSGSNVALPARRGPRLLLPPQRPRPPRFTITGAAAPPAERRARGIVDIGLTTRPASPDDPTGLARRRLAASGVCLVTNRANPLPGLDRAADPGARRGRATTWAQCREPASPLLSRPPRSRRRPASTRSSRPPSSTSPPRSLYRPRTFATPAAGARLRARHTGRLGLRRLRVHQGLHVVPYEGVPARGRRSRAAPTPRAARSRS